MNAKHTNTRLMNTPFTPPLLRQIMDMGVLPVPDFGTDIITVITIVIIVVVIIFFYGARCPLIKWSCGGGCPWNATYCCISILNVPLGNCIYCSIALPNMAFRGRLDTWTWRSSDRNPQPRRSFERGLASEVSWLQAADQASG